ncbi:hypothetical protein BDZ97DRAFT_1651757 [Flammula alnicola]|nr:hypothetical protein BDZ97DRAFT_1651757 [Flammula alnicola]
MVVEKKTSLRVLYTINSSQYILARSHTPVQVTLIPPSEDSNSRASLNASQSPILYANVLLKTCLNTICRSSPELTHDNTRDFSLYVLDPLESNSAPAPVHISNVNGESSSSKSSTKSAEQSVAVGLGLMSWALNADDSDAMAVVGTLVKQSNGQEAVEVIFALRETTAMKRPAWSMAPPSSQHSNFQESSFNSTAESVSGQHDSKQPQSHSLSQVRFPTPIASSSTQTRSSTVDLTRETLASIHMRSKPKTKPPKPVRQSTVPVTESDKLMNADTFIGPLKKKGRPKSTNPDPKAPAPNGNAAASSSGSLNNAKEVIVIDDSDSDGTIPTPTNSTFQNSAMTAKGPVKVKSDIQDLKKKKVNYSQHPTTSLYTTVPLVRPVTDVETNSAPVQVKVEPREEPSLLDVLAYFSATSPSEPNAQNAAILAALCTIDSSSNQGNAPPAIATNPALVSALKQLLSVCSNPTPTNSEPTPHSQQLSSSSFFVQLTDDGIVILDKENVNPKVYKKSNAKDNQGAKFSDPAPTTATSLASVSIGQSSHPERPLQSLGPSVRSNETNLSKSSLKESVLASGMEKVARKRTLSDFMDEKECGRNKGKERERVERRDGHRHTNTQRTQKAPVNDALRHYPRLLASSQPRTEQPSNYYRTPLESMTSPARPRHELDDGLPAQPHTAVANSESQSLSKPPSPKPQRISASSPVRGTNHENRRKYVVPEWARTSTSTRPRLSEEAQRAIEKLEEKKRLERAAARKRLPSAQVKKNGITNTKSTTSLNERQEKEPVAPEKPDGVQAPVPVSARPMFAAANVTFPFISTRSSSPPPNASGIPKTPKTPTRDRHHVRPTPGRESDSLFTPIARSGSLFGSAHSRSGQTPLLPSVLTSPLGNRKKAKISPSKSLLTGRSFTTPGSWGNTSSLQSSEDSKVSEEPQSKQSFERELEDAMDDLECPPSSLPIASSDIDIDELHTQTSGDVDVNINDDPETIPIKQHWQGLPPSSPPAPSSPMPLPESTTDDEMDDLPIATSDSETDTEMTPGDSDASPSNGNSPEYFNDQLADAMASTDFSSFFPMEGSTSNSEQSPNVVDIFDQFTHLNSESDVFPSVGDSVDPELETLFQNGLDGIDFTEFWETFKPLVNDSTQVPHDRGDGGHPNCFDMRNEDGSLTSFGEIDHVKLADEMQALLSGCLM